MSVLQNGQRVHPTAELRPLGHVDHGLDCHVRDKNCVLGEGGVSLSGLSSQEWESDFNS